MKNTAGGSVRRALISFVPEPLSLQNDTAGRLGGDETGRNMFCPGSQKHCWRGGVGEVETGPYLFYPRTPILYTTDLYII